MQPHSTCAIALANYIYNFHHRPHRAKGLIRIEFQNRFGEYKSLIYTFEDLRSRGEDYRRGFTVWVKKSGDPLSCILTVHTPEGSPYEGRHYFITHGTQHRAGLEEHFDLYRTGIRNGHHRNSEKYEDYSATFLQDNQIAVSSNLKKTKKHERQHLTFRIKIESMNMQFLPSHREDQSRHQHRKEEDISGLHEKQSGVVISSVPAESTTDTQTHSVLHWRDILLFGGIGLVIVVVLLLTIIFQVVSLFR